MKTAKFGLLLAPGAGADRDQATLVAIDQALSKLGGVVTRMDFPYRKQGRKAPDRQPVLVESVLAELEKLSKKKSLTNKPVFAGGRSMGGRMTSIAVAEGAPVSGLVLISYPLHPPGKPEKMRTDHFPEIKIPCLFFPALATRSERLRNSKKQLNRLKATSHTFGSKAETTAYENSTTKLWPKSRAGSAP